MVSGGGMTCVKMLMIVFNFLFWLAGLALIIIGAISQNESTKINYVNPAAVVIIVIGVIIFVLAFLGCCGALKENRPMLILFGVLMIIILILAITAIVLAFVYKSQARDLWKEAMKQSIKDYNSKTPGSFIFNWQELQLEEKCCGVDNYTDWTHNKEYADGKFLPPSCCNDTTKQCPVEPLTEQKKTGCGDAVLSEVEYKYLIVGGVVIGVMVLMIIGATFAFCLASAIRKDYNVV